MEEATVDGGVFELLAGPFGRGDLVVRSFRGKEGVSRLFRFDVVVHTERDPELLEPALLAQPATLVLHVPRRAPRLIRGIVDRITFRGVDPSTGRNELSIRLVPKLWLLKRRVRSRIFQNLTLPEIVETVLRAMDVPFRFVLRRAPPRRSYCVQYQESDYAFITRICAEDGLFFFFEAPPIDLDLLLSPSLTDAVGAPSETVVFGDSADAYPPIADETVVEELLPTTRTFADGFGAVAIAPWIPFRVDAGMQIDDEYVDTLHSTRAVRSKAVHRRDWNYRHPTLDLDARAVVSTDVSGRVTLGPASLRSPAALGVEVDVEAPAAIDPNRLEVYIHHGDYDEPKVQSELAQIELEQLRRDARVFFGTGTARRFSAGHRFRLDGHVRSELDREYAIVAVAHEGNVPELGESAGFVYRNRFSAVKASVVRRPEKPKARLQQVLESAIVVGPADEEIHTDELGRIKVQFHWDREGARDDFSSCWIRVASPWAGPGFGVQFVPRVGTEVLVSFLGGDEDKPVVVGSVHNQVSPPPFRLPGNKTRGGIRTRSTPKGTGYNELAFDDAAGAELVLLSAERDLSIEVGHDAKTSVRGDAKTTVLGDADSETAGRRTTIVRGDESHTTAGTFARIVGSDERVVVNGAKIVGIDGSETRASFGSAQHVAADHRLRVEGSSTTSVGSDAREGALSFLTVGSELHEATRTISVRADEQIVLGVGDNRIVVDKTGVRIDAARITLRGKDAVTVFGKGPATEWTDKIDVVSDRIALYAGGASITLGDDAIQIESSEVEIGTEPAALSITDQPPAPGTKRFKWRLLDRDRLPFKGKTYRLFAEGFRQKGQTDDDGFVEADLPESARVAEVMVWGGDYPTGRRTTFAFHLEDLPASSSVVGAAARLKNLGYYLGKPTEKVHAELAAAIRDFQQDAGVASTGELDGDTVAALAAAHP